MPGDKLRSDEENLIAGMEREEAARAVRRALKRVSEKHQAVLRRCDMDGWTYDATARSLGVAVGTVRSRIVRARQALLRRSPELAAVA